MRGGPVRHADPSDDDAGRHHKRWVGLLGCLSAIALFLLLAIAIVWWTESGIFGPPDRPPAPLDLPHPPASNQP